jgi:hypothetical protein
VPGGAAKRGLLVVSDYSAGLLSFGAADLVWCLLVPSTGLPSAAHLQHRSGCWVEGTQRDGQIRFAAGWNRLAIYRNDVLVYTALTRWEALTRLKKLREELKGPGRAQSDQNGPEVTAPREWGGAARLEARLTWAPMNKSSCAATARGRSELHRAGKRNCGLRAEHESGKVTCDRAGRGQSGPDRPGA